MIKEDQLTNYRPNTQFPDGKYLTLEMIQEEIEKHTVEIGVPVAFYKDVVKSGGLFNSSTEDCLVIHHPEHEQDYYKFCIRISMQGDLAIVKVQIFGNSKQIKKDILGGAYDKVKKGQSLSNKIMISAVKGIRTFGLNKQTLAKEKEYYEIIANAFNKTSS